MAKAKRPVSIDGIEFDALISEERFLRANIPEYVVEDGFTVSDTVTFKSETITMTLYVTDTPVTWKGSHGGPGWVESVCLRLEDLYYKGSPVTVITSDRTYHNMCIESISFTKIFEEGYARAIPVTFKQIRKTKAKTTHIPAKYGKSGVSYGNNGTANVSSGSISSTNNSTLLPESNGIFAGTNTTPTNPNDIDLRIGGMLGTVGGSVGVSDMDLGTKQGSILHGLAGALGWI